MIEIAKEMRDNYSIDGYEFEDSPGALKEFAIDYIKIYEENEKLKLQLKTPPAFSNASGQWVSVKDRLPEQNQLCWVIYRATPKNRWYGVSTFCKDKFDSDTVTHWMIPIEKPIDA